MNRALLVLLAAIIAGGSYAALGALETRYAMEDRI